MPTLQALKTLYNRAEYGRVTAGQMFACSEETARLLERRGVARRLPGVYETKIITPEVQTLPAEPFRVVHLPDPAQTRLANESNHGLEVPDVPEPGTTDPRERADGSGDSVGPEYPPMASAGETVGRGRPQFPQRQRSRRGDRSLG